MPESPSAARPSAPSRLRLRPPTWSACLLCLGLISCGGSEPAFAQPRIQVLMKNGDQWEQELPGIRKMAFLSPNLVVTLANGATRQFVHADIRRITFQVPSSSRLMHAPGESGRGLTPALETARSSDGGIALNLVLPAAAELRLDVLSLDGAKVRTLAAGGFPGGAHALEWDGRDDAGRPVEPGAFLVAATAAGRTLARKILWQGGSQP